MKKIAFLTSGGDSPGMNACIRAIVKSCLHDAIIPVAIKDGYKGMIENQFLEMKEQDVANIIQLGGTIIGTARSEEFKQADFRLRAINHLKANQIEGLIVIGGDGTFTGARLLSQEMHIPIIGIPGTIDNDVYGTDRTIGYDTAINTIVGAVDRIRDTAFSHHRVFFVEVMGRHSGHLALNAAIASGADSVLLPESHESLDLLVEQILQRNKLQKGNVILVAEGDEQGGSIELMNKLKPKLKSFDLRATVLGHIQRGGSPNAFDRILATRMGAFAVELLQENQTNLMIGSKGDELHSIPIQDGISLKKDPISAEQLKIVKKILSLN